ncbi:MAG: hypothetical protein HZA46_19645 [Planctomycetales bacterium]|nr:hypothetical protein [Planctomycetales bacterium]
MSNTWPTSTDYFEAVQNSAQNFSDAELKAAEVVVNQLGLPQPCAGNFADVYQFRSKDGKRGWAVKCFTHPALKRGERYREISKHLDQAKLPFSVEFKYLEEGVRIRGQWYPVVKMDWVEGQTLYQFMKENLQKPRIIEVLYNIWLKVEPRLRLSQAAHGDLQHGNVMLVPGTTENSLALKLIDYDGMWVSSLGGQSPDEVGHPSYQHPQRAKKGLYTIDVDRFPHLVIAFALRCLARPEGPQLWETYDSGENLLFSKSDFEIPAKSKLLRDLWNTGDKELQAWVGHFAMASRAPLPATPLLEKLLADGRMPPLSKDDEVAVRTILELPPLPSEVEVKRADEFDRLNKEFEMVLDVDVKTDVVKPASGTIPTRLPPPVVTTRPDTKPVPAKPTPSKSSAPNPNGWPLSTGQTVLLATTTFAAVAIIGTFVWLGFSGVPKEKLLEAYAFDKLPEGFEKMSPSRLKSYGKRIDEPGRKQIDEADGTAWGPHAAHLFVIPRNSPGQVVWSGAGPYGVKIHAWDGSVFSPVNPPVEATTVGGRQYTIPAEASDLSRPQELLVVAVNGSPPAIIPDFNQRPAGWKREGKLGNMSTDLVRFESSKATEVSAATGTQQLAASSTTDATTLKFVRAMGQPNWQPVRLVVSPDGRDVVSIDTNTQDKSANLQLNCRSLTTGSQQLLPTLIPIPLPNTKQCDMFFRPDGTLLLVGSPDQLALASSGLLARFTDNGRRPFALSADGRWLMTAHDTEPRLDLWDVANSPRRVRGYRFDTKPATGLAFTTDGQHTLVGDTDANICTLNLRTGGIEQQFRGATQTEAKRSSSGDAYRVRFSPASSLAAVLSANGEASVWDVASGKQISSIPVAPGTIPTVDVALSPNGLGLVQGDQSGALHVFNLKQGSELPLAVGGPDARTAAPYLFAAFSPDGRHIVSGVNSPQQAVQVWELSAKDYSAPSAIGSTVDLWFGQPAGSAGKAGASAVVEQRLEFQEPLAITTREFALDPRGEKFVYPTKDSIVTIPIRHDQTKSVADAASQDSVKSSLANIDALVLAHHSGETLCAVTDYQSAFGEIMATSQASFSLLRLESHQTIIKSQTVLSRTGLGPLVIFSRSGERVYVAEKSRITVWDTADGKLLTSVNLSRFTTDNSPGLGAGMGMSGGSSRLTDNRQPIALAADDQEVHVVLGTGDLVTLDAKKHEVARTFSLSSHSLRNATFSADNALVLVTPEQESAAVPPSSRAVPPRPGTKSSVGPNFLGGEMTAPSSWANVINVSTGAEILRLESVNDAVTTSAISADNRWAVTGHVNGHLRVWNLSNGKLTHDVDPQSVVVPQADQPAANQKRTSPITKLQFDQTENLLASLTADGSCRLWRLSPNLESTAPTPKSPVVGEPMPPPNSQAAAGSPRPVFSKTHEFNGGSGTSLGISADGGRIASGGTVWNANGQVIHQGSGPASGYLFFNRGVSSVLFMSGGLKAQNLIGSQTLNTAHSATGEFLAATNREKEFLVGNSSGGIQLVVLGEKRIKKQFATDPKSLVFSLAHARNAAVAVSRTPEGVSVWNSTTGSLERLLSLTPKGNVAGNAVPGGGALQMSSSGFPVGISANGTRVVCVAPLEFGCSLVVWDLDKVDAESTNLEPNQWLGKGRIVVRDSYGREASKKNQLPDPCLAVSPDGKLAVVTDLKGNSLEVWDLGTGQEISLIEGHTGRVTVALFSDDGQHLVSSSQNREVILWRLQREATTIATAKDSTKTPGSTPAPQPNAASKITSPNPASPIVSAKPPIDSDAVPLAEGYKIDSPPQDIFKQNPQRVLQTNPSEKMTRGELIYLQNAGENRTVSTGKYHLFVFPNRGPMKLTWTGLLLKSPFAKENEISIRAWDGKAYLERTSEQTGISQTLTVDIDVPTSEKQVYLLVSSRTGRFSTDAVTATAEQAAKE